MSSRMRKFLPFGKTMFRRELPKYNGMSPLSSKRKAIVFATPLVTMEVVN